MGEERALYRGAISKKWWLIRIREIHKETEMVSREIEEKGSTYVCLRNLEKLQKRRESWSMVKGMWISNERKLEKKNGRKMND
jgi:hypothetical protein